MGSTARRIVINPLQPEPDRIAELAALLCAGAVVAVPTDTVYGLAADAADAAAVARVFAAKGREETKPLPIFIRDRAQARELAQAWPEAAERLAEAFWPGALTLIVPARRDLAAWLPAGQETIALRQPAHALVAALLAATGRALTGTSANRSGQAPCRSAAEVAAQLGDRIAAIADGGPSAPGAQPSTIVDVSGARPRLARAGAIPAAAIAAVVPLTDPGTPA